MIPGSYIEKGIQNPVDAPYLTWIKAGVKVFEGRLATKIIDWDLFIGKKIKFYDENKSESYAICEITNLLKFKDFAEAYDSLGTKLIIGKTRLEVIRLYNEFNHYEDEKIVDGVTSQMIIDNGVVAINIKVIFQQ